MRQERGVPWRGGDIKRGQCSAQTAQPFAFLSQLRFSAVSFVGKDRAYWLPGEHNGRGTILITIYVLIAR